MATACKLAALAGLCATALASSASANGTDFGVWNKPDFGEARPATRAEPLIIPEPYRGAGPLWKPLPESPSVADGGPRPAIVAQPPPVVMVQQSYPAGTVVVDTDARTLYYVNGDGTAFAYPIGVGREGFEWSGSEKVSRIASWPDWYPPAEMRQRKPGLPEKMTGGLRNPLGAMAIYLGNSLYRIHGTDAPETIGTAQSSGCIRMLNEHVTHLAQRVAIGTDVVVVRALDPAFVVARVPEPKPAVRPSRTAVLQ